MEKSLFSELVRKFIRDEALVNANEKAISNPFISHVLDLHVAIPGEEIIFRIYTAREDEPIKHAFFTIVNNEELAIVFEHRFFEKLWLNYPMEVLLGILAHEVGHYLSGHHDHNPINMNLNTVDEKQTRLLKLYKKLKDPRLEKAYYRTCVSGLLRGGHFIGEIEADMKSLHFISKEFLVNAHIVAMADYEVHHSNGSRWPELEKLNRLKYIQREIEDGDISQDGYALSIKSPEVYK